MFVLTSIEKGEVYHSKRTDNIESDAIFPPKQTVVASRPNDDVQKRLDSLVIGSSAVTLLAETHILKLNHNALKSTFINRVSCGERHVLLLTSSGFVYSMGSNEQGQLGNANDEVE